MLGRQEKETYRKTKKERRNVRGKVERKRRMRKKEQQKKRGDEVKKRITSVNDWKINKKVRQKGGRKNGKRRNLKER